MQTVQIQCGSCNRVMAVQVEHLGSQVHCPHCQAIVQAPAARPPARPEDRREDHDETASIFGTELSDAIFPTVPSPSAVEMPPEINSLPIRAESASPGHAADRFDAADWSGRPGAADAPRHKPERATEAPPPLGSEPPAAASDDRHEDADLAALTPRKVVKSTPLAPILLIFLVPYAILATVVIAYLLINHGRPVDPLERLPDPKPKDGGPRLQERVRFDAPLTDKLKTGLLQPLWVGALEVTPVKVQRAGNELVLHLKMKNMSTDQLFNPISQEFMKYVGESPPYTYLDWAEKKLFGGFTEWLRGPEGKEEPFGGDIGPGQEELIRVVTMPKYKDDVQRIAASRDALLWRVHVRRGFVETRGGNQVSATAVVGITFNAQDIQKD
jgi:hypothetical protein